MRGLAILILASGVLLGASRCENERGTHDAGLGKDDAGGKGGAGKGAAGKGAAGKGAGVGGKGGPSSPEPDEKDAGREEGEPCGPTTCDVGQVCCNESCGTCTEPGGFCTEQFCGPLDAGVEVRQFCGGFAGLPCPGAGTCEDDPDDGCDPNRGGADCGGFCTCHVQGLCLAGAVWDDSPEVCACVPAPDACAGVRCKAGSECRVAADGSASCVRSGPRCGARQDDDGCPGLGDCIDDPTDDCDPPRDADCPGVCTCEAVPKCMADQIFDSHPEVCACTDDTVNPCAAILCPVNTRCEVQSVQCIRAPCPAQATCVPL